jgi:hypothetical protein
MRKVGVRLTNSVRATRQEEDVERVLRNDAGNAGKRRKHHDTRKIEPPPNVELVPTSCGGSLTPGQAITDESSKIDFGEILGPELTARLQRTLGTSDLYLTLMLLIQANSAAGCPDSIDPKSLVSHFPAAALSSLGVRDGLEALLSAQMVSVHSLAMKFLARAAVKNQTDAGIELNVNRANKLLRTFTAQVEALKKHRSTGEQHVTVEHVTVQSGGQAVVGAVNLQRARTKPNQGPGGGDKENVDQ